jgi:hypothetical protein
MGRILQIRYNIPIGPMLFGGSLLCYAYRLYCKLYILSIVYLHLFALSGTEHFVKGNHILQL